MSVGTSVNKAGPFIGNSATVLFPFAFRIFTSADVLVTRTSTPGTGSVESTLVEGADYAVAVNADQDNNPGGTVTAVVAPTGDGTAPNSQLLTLSRTVAETQGTQLPQAGPYNAKIVEKAFDKATILIQQLREVFTRVPAFAVSDTPPTNKLPTKAARSSMFAAWSSTGDWIASAGPGTTPVSVAWAAVVNAATLALGRAAMGFSAYFDTLISAANAAAMRTLLLIDGTSRVLKAGDMADSMMGFSLRNGTFIPSQNGTVLTIAIKTLAGGDPSAADPVYVVFRNPTATNGAYQVVTLTAATSISTTVGGTFGVANNVAFRLWIVGFNDGGVFRLGLINCTASAAAAGAGQKITSQYPLGQFPIASSTQIGAGSTSAGVFYTAGAAVASKAYAVLGYLTYESGLAAAGTFGVNQSRTHMQNVGDPLPGQRIGGARFDTGTTATGTTTVPGDNTIPQNTEGDQYMTLSYTPSSAANGLRHRDSISLSPDTNFGFSVISIYQDTTANALASSGGYNNSVNGSWCLFLDYFMLAGGSVSSAFKIRGGNSSANTMRFNGQAAIQLYGGVYNSYMDIEEVMT